MQTDNSGDDLQEQHFGLKRLCAFFELFKEHLGETLRVVDELHCGKSSFAVIAFSFDLLLSDGCDHSFQFSLFFALGRCEALFFARQERERDEKKSVSSRSKQRKRSE